MNATQALGELALDLQPDAAPALTQAELTVVLGVMAVADAAGVAPGGTGWVPTYDRARLARAVYRGLQAKAAKVAGKLTYSADGQSYNAGDLADQIGRQMQRVATQLNGTTGSVRTTSSNVLDDCGGGGLPHELPDDAAIGVLP